MFCLGQRGKHNGHIGIKLAGIKGLSPHAEVFFYPIVSECQGEVLCLCLCVHAA